MSGRAIATGELAMYLADQDAAVADWASNEHEGIVTWLPTEVTDPGAWADELAEELGYEPMGVADGGALRVLYRQGLVLVLAPEADEPARLRATIVDLGGI